MRRLFSSAVHAVIPEPEHGFRIRILKTLVIIALVAFTSGLIIRNWIGPFTQFEWGMAVFILAAYLTSVILVLRFRLYEAGAWALLFSFWLTIIITGALFGGIRAPGVANSVLVPLISVAILGRRYSQYVTLFIIASILAITLLTVTGRVPYMRLPVRREALSLASIYTVLSLLSYWLAKTYDVSRLDTEKRLIELSRIIDLGTLSAGISHEINNPTAAIQNGLEILEVRTKTSTLDDHSAKPILALMRSSVQRIRKITELLDQYAQDESQRAQVECSIDEIIHNTLSLCQERIASAAILVEVQELSSKPVVKCHPSEISRILMSLIDNSYDAVLELKKDQPKWIRISVIKKRLSVEILVSDSGRGIPIHLRKFLFTPFFTTKRPGKGLGLALANGALVMHGYKGRLYLDESAPNTTFVISLPR
jgi:signal transduction histidine kinase